VKKTDLRAFLHLACGLLPSGAMSYEIADRKSLPSPIRTSGCRRSARRDGQDVRKIESAKVSVVVPCRNEVDSIERCILSILAQEEPEGSYEVVVADGLSDDGTREKLDALAAGVSRLRVISNPGRIVSSGLNAAIAAAEGGIIVRMDAHAEYAPDYIRECVRALAETGADNVGGPARTRSDGYTQRAIAAAYHSPFSVGGARFHLVDYEGYSDTVTYGCWRRELLERLGGFDEKLVRNQDDEFNLRIVRSGGRVWQTPRIRSWYHPRRNLRQLFQQYLQYGYWKVRVIRKHRIPASPRHLVPGLMCLGLAGLAGLGFFWTAAWWIASLVILLYGLLNLTASALCSVRHGLTLFPILPAVFACYHFGYGLGFLWGLGDALRRSRGPSAAVTQLTRGSRAWSPSANVLQ
jgi:succinoglycan biosynthesis protein ExoA